MKKKVFAISILSSLLFASISVATKISYASNETSTAYMAERSTFTLNPFVLGVDNEITGVVPSNGTDLALSVNGVEIIGFGMIPGQNFKLSQISKITSPNDDVIITIRDRSFQIVGQEKLVIVDGLNLNTGNVTADKFLIDRFDRVTGQFKGDVGSLSMRINGIIQERQSTRDNGTFSYNLYGRTLDKADIVEILAYNSRNELISFSTLLLEDGSINGRFLETTSNRVHQHAISVDLTISIEPNTNHSIRVIVPEINGVKDYSQLIDSPVLQPNFFGIFSNVFEGDSIRLIGFNAYGQVADIVDLTGI